MWHKDPITTEANLLKTTPNPTASISSVSKPRGKDVYHPPAVPRRVTCTCNVIYLASLGSKSPLNSLRPGSVCSSTHHQRVKFWLEWSLTLPLILQHEDLRMYKAVNILCKGYECSLVSFIQKQINKNTIFWLWHAWFNK